MATFYQSCGTTNELGPDFVVLGKMRQRVIGWQQINARMWRPDDEKEAFYAQLEEIYDGCPQRDVKIGIGDTNAQVGREAMYRPVIGPNSLHAVTNDFAASRVIVVRSSFFPHKDIHKPTWRSPNQLTENQIDHILIDGKFFADITNVRTYCSANVDSDHFLVAICMRSKLSTVYNTRRSQTSSGYGILELLKTTRNSWKWHYQRKSSLAQLLLRMAAGTFDPPEETPQQQMRAVSEGEECSPGENAATPNVSERGAI